MNLHERKLSYQARKHLAKSDFVFPKDRRYPIEDKAHARNALARVSQHGSSSEKAKVRAAVHSKYPDIGESLVDQLIPPIPLEERSQHEIGTELEKEHFRGGKPKDKTPGQVADTHLGENPRYYPTNKKPKGAKEALRWVKEHCGHCGQDRTSKRLTKLFKRRPDLLAHPRI